MWVGNFTVAKGGMQQTQDLKFPRSYVDALASALSERDRYTGEHCERTSTICLDLGRSCALGAHELTLLRTAAAMHDIGKLAIPDRILFKPGPLDQQERVAMQAHADIGAAMLQDLPLDDMDVVARVVRHHHEAYDGRGYPDGLAGDSIPLLSRIITLADSYDAMATTRPYQAARTHGQVMSLLDREQGGKYDPYLWLKFVRSIEKSVQGTR